MNKGNYNFFHTDSIAEGGKNIPAVRVNSGNR